MSIPAVKYAIVCGVPNTFNACVKPRPDETVVRGVDLSGPIDVERARSQQQKYFNTLRSEFGLKLVELPPDDKLPDSCFTADPVVILGKTAVISNMGAPSRKGEIEAMKKLMRKMKMTVHQLHGSGTLEGGDVLPIGKDIFVGISRRTNEEGFRQFKAIVSREGYNAIPVRMSNDDSLHLTTIASYLGGNTVAYVAGHFADDLFSKYDTIVVPREEAYAANMLGLDGKVLMAEGFPVTKRAVEARGFKVYEIPMSEMRKANGSMTCLWNPVTTSVHDKIMSRLAS